MGATRERVVIYMPKLGHTTGEMPHLRKPPVNWMPGQMLYYLYASVIALGHEARVVDANWALAPIDDVLRFRPDKVLISTATPTFEDTQRSVSALRAHGYRGPIFVGGPHVSLNAGMRDWLLPELEGVTYISLVGSRSTFDWVPEVFPGQTQFEVLGLPDKEARQLLIDRTHEETGRIPSDVKLESLLFSHFSANADWMDEAYFGAGISPEMARIPVRYSTITSIGCSKTCSFCGNPYIYRIGFKRKEVVRKEVRALAARGADRISVADMFFVMHLPHTQQVMDVFREEGVGYSMQTCLENLTDPLMDELARSGLQKMLVGVENPVSYSVGKRVEIAKVRWLLEKSSSLGLTGIKLSYIVGLPGVKLATDIALIDHVAREVLVRGHPLQDLQCNLYTPYRPEPDTEYSSFGAGKPTGPLRLNVAQRVRILDALPFGYWGSFPVGITDPEDLWRQMVLCDVVYDVIYTAFLDRYLEVRAQYVEDLARIYPSLRAHVPTFETSRATYRTMARSRELETAVGNDAGHGRRVMAP